jgi:hypothetical protein
VGSRQQIVDKGRTLDDAPPQRRRSDLAAHDPPAFHGRAGFWRKRCLA